MQSACAYIQNEADSAVFGCHTKQTKTRYLLHFLFAITVNGCLLKHATLFNSQTSLYVLPSLPQTGLGTEKHFSGQRHIFVPSRITTQSALKSHETPLQGPVKDTQNDKKVCAS